jgi:hypothetical protein
MRGGFRLARSQEEEEVEEKVRRSRTAQARWAKSRKASY